jgi:hypothetical protein
LQTAFNLTLATGGNRFCDLMGIKHFSLPS